MLSPVLWELWGGARTDGESCARSADVQRGIPHGGPGRLRKACAWRERIRDGPCRCVRQQRWHAQQHMMLTSVSGIASRYAENAATP